MKYNKILAIIGFVLLGIQSQAHVKPTDTLYADAIKPLGRTVINNQHNLELITSGAHFGVSFTGNICKIYASNGQWLDRNYLQYELDGVYQKKIRITTGSKEPVVIQTNSSGPHQLWIYKATEAQTGALVIEKVAATAIKSIQIPKLPLIEFIGNSITCGALSDTSEMSCGKGEYQDYHNAYMAYGPRVARALNVNFIMSSVSGIGIYRTYNTETSSMPKVYEHTDFQMNGDLKWNFKTYAPKIVSIALGTNDMSKGDGKPRVPFDSARFVREYVKFVQLVKGKYPEARIALLSSPMTLDTSRTILITCLTRVQDRINKLYPSDKSVAVFSFEPMSPRGCYYHPSVADHEILAAELKPFYARLLSE